MNKLAVSGGTIPLVKNITTEKTMKVQSFEYMRTIYGGNRDLEPDDLKEREKLLTEYKYSVIVEGEHMEYDNLHKWMKQNIQTEPVEEIHYGKTDYDYGFVEFFLAEKIQEEKLRLAVPNIYTTYPFSNPPGKICKSDGSDKDIEYTPTDKNAIVYSADEKA
ncbi:MAG: hypothetical protein K1X91_07850 [Bacteriodetes bacterium]|nr:hypothetical protein [Bacteroidota bacterium]